MKKKDKIVAIEYLDEMDILISKKRSLCFKKSQKREYNKWRASSDYFSDKTTLILSFSIGSLECGDPLEDFRILFLCK